MRVGSAMIVLGLSLFVLGLLALRAYLGFIGVGVGAVIGLGFALRAKGIRRQRDIHPF